MDKQTLAERLKLSREQAGLSQGQVARLLKLHRPTISEIEAGRRSVSAEELRIFSELYEVSLNWLVNDEPNVQDSKIELVARHLSKLSNEDIDKLLDVLKTMKTDR